jgi:hypothetical protein
MLRALAARDPRITVLDEKTAEAVAKRVVERFVIDSDRTWWWESLRDVTEVVSYEGENGLERLAERIGTEPNVYLLATNEQAKPHGVLAGPLDALLQLFGESSFFEFAIIDAAFRWVIFDTHHNTLIVAGDPPRRSAPVPP